MLKQQLCDLALKLPSISELQSQLQALKSDVDFMKSNDSGKLPKAACVNPLLPPLPLSNRFSPLSPDGALETEKQHIYKHTPLSLTKHKGTENGHSTVRKHNPSDNHLLSQSRAHPPLLLPAQDPNLGCRTKHATLSLANGHVKEKQCLVHPLSANRSIVGTSSVYPLESSIPAPFPDRRPRSLEAQADRKFFL